jgi:hypothetical protein
MRGGAPVASNAHRARNVRVVCPTRVAVMHANHVGEAYAVLTPSALEQLPPLRCRWGRDVPWIGPPVGHAELE